MDKTFKKTLGWIFSSFSVLCFVSLIGLFGKFGKFFNQTGYGLFGQSLIPVYASLLIIGIAFIKDKEFTDNKKMIGLGAALLVLLIVILDLFTTQKYIVQNRPGQYLASVAAEGSGTAGGVFFSLLLCIPLCYIKTTLPTILVLFALFFICLFVMGKSVYIAKKEVFAQRKKEKEKIASEETGDLQMFKSYVDERKIQPQTDESPEDSGVSRVVEGAGYELYNEEYYNSPERINLNNLNESVVNKHFVEEEAAEKEITIDPERDIATVYSSDVEEKEVITKTVTQNAAPKTVPESVGPEKTSAMDDKPDVSVEKSVEISPVIEEIPAKQAKESAAPTPVDPNKYFGYFQNKIIPVDEVNLETTIEFEGDYKVPAPSTFDDVENNEPISEEEVLMYRDQIEEAFKMLEYPAEFLDYIVGCSIIRYEFKCVDKAIGNISMDRYAKVIKTGLTVDLRTIHTRMPGKLYTIGIDIVNPKKQSISFKEMVSEETFWKQKGISFVVGKSPEGTSYYCNVEELPHMLIAGATGSGKSVCMQSIVASLIYKNDPRDLRIVIIDTKPQDFVHFENTPHMLFGGVISNNKVALNALEYLKEEIARRNKLLKDFAISKISELKKRNCNFVLPKIVILFDEYNDMLLNFPETQKAISDDIIAISQVGRAVGVHIIIATQRPAADVIDSTIRANLTSRIVLKVTDATNSTVALGSGLGSESDYKAHLLSGNGDLILRYKNISENLQAPFISEEDLLNLCQYVRENNEYGLNQDLISRINTIEALQPVEAEPAPGPAPVSNFKKPIYQQIKRDKMLSIYDFCAGTDQYGNVSRREVSYSVISTNITIGNTQISPLLQWFTEMNIIAAPANEKKKYFIVSREEFISILDEYGNEN